MKHWMKALCPFCIVVYRSASLLSHLHLAHNQANPAIYSSIAGTSCKEHTQNKNTSKTKRHDDETKVNLHKLLPRDLFHLKYGTCEYGLVNRKMPYFGTHNPETEGPILFHTGTHDGTASTASWIGTRVARRRKQIRLTSLVGTWSPTC